MKLLIVGLAAWRLASLLMREAGPLDVFTQIRERIFGYEHFDGAPVSWPDHPDIRYMLRCMWCTSLWTALIAYYLPKPLKYVLAASAIAIAVDHVKDNIDLPLVAAQGAERA